MSRALSLAGFQVTLIGRIWVTPEAQTEKEGLRAFVYDSQDSLQGRRELYVGSRLHGDVSRPICPSSQFDGNGMFARRELEACGCVSYKIAIKVYDASAAVTTDFESPRAARSLPFRV